MPLITPELLKQLHQTIQKYETEEYGIGATIKKITNNDKTDFAIDTVVYMKADESKLVQYLYRDNWSDYEKSIKKAIDSLTNLVTEEIKKDKNSL